MRIEFKGEYCGEHGEIVLDMRKTEHGTVAVTIHLRLFNHCEFVFPCVLLGYDLAKFVKAVQQIHKSLLGTALLESQDQHTQLNFTVEHSGRGIVSVRGRLSNAAYYVPGNVLPHSPVEAGIDFRFGGLLTDQSYLPGLVESITQFLADEDISTASPWGIEDTHPVSRITNNNRGQSSISEAGSEEKRGGRT